MIHTPAATFFALAFSSCTDPPVTYFLRRRRAHAAAAEQLHEASTTLALSPTSRTRGGHQTSSVNVFTPAANGLGLHRKTGDAGGGISSRPATMLGKGGVFRTHARSRNRSLALCVF